MLNVFYTRLCHFAIFVCYLQILMIFNVYLHPIEVNLPYESFPQLIVVLQPTEVLLASIYSDYSQQFSTTPIFTPISKHYFVAG